MSNPEDTDNLTAKQIAPYLGVYCNTVLKWARDGWIPCIRAGHKYVRFNLTEVRKALRNTQNKPK